MITQDAVLAVLEGAQALHSAPSTWARGHFATDKHGSVCEPLCHKSVCFCPVGAVSRVAATLYAGKTGGIYSGALEAIRKVIDRQSIEIWNDAKERTFADVRKMWIEAIAARRARVTK